jgi:predicted fused transcriptional regulator/phosphomethylpyrimidine kinase
MNIAEKLAETCLETDVAQVESLLSDYSDTFKENNGFRPGVEHFQSVDQLVQAIDQQVAESHAQFEIKYYNELTDAEKYAQELEGFQVPQFTLGMIL